MNIIIIEDEKLTAKDLEDIILEVLPSAKIEAVLYSVRQAVTYFENNPPPELIFCDIQLGDGLSFDIFTKIKIQTPIIFCTAYDEYALNAFKLNGIDYILKPFTKESIQQALNKYHDLSLLFKDTSANTSVSLEDLQDLIHTMNPTKVSNILVHHKEKIIPIKVTQIAVFYIENQITYLRTFTGENYFLNKTLDQVDQLVGDQFFRANRQFLINKDAVNNASHQLSRKFSVSLTIPFEHAITVSRDKLNDFLAWLTT